jgi:Cd2+/Zn2+-exporting ATPase
MTTDGGDRDGRLADGFAKVELDIEFLLPASVDQRDQCRVRLQEGLAARKGVITAHIEESDGRARLCIHYDPHLLTLAAVQRLATDAGANVSARYRHERIPIEGMDCSDCTTVIEHALQRLPGVLTASANYAAGSVAIEYDSDAVDRRRIEARLESLGYAVPKGGPAAFIAGYRELVFALLAGVFALCGWAAGRTGMNGNVGAGLFLAAYPFGGWDVARHAWHTLRQGRATTDLLMVAAALGAAALGQFGEGALLLFLFSLGHALEELALDRARDAVGKLGQLMPRTALARREGRDVEVPVESLGLEDVVIVRPGVRIPVDGAVRVGSSSVDQSPVTGESVPVDKKIGDKVFAGTVNGEGALEVQVSRLAKDNTLARVMRLVEDAEGQKTGSQRMTEQFTSWFVPAVLVGTLLLIVVPPAFGIPFRDTFLRAMTLLVAASPCALALGPPSAVLAGIAQAARNGLLIKGGVHLETLGRVSAIAFDKTGTLTHGRPEVTDVMAVDQGGGAVDRLLSVAAAVEARSGHPLAQAVVRAARARGLPEPSAADLVSVTGRGVRSSVDGESVRIGNRRLFDEDGMTIPETLSAQLRRLEEEGKTTMIVGVGTRVAGALAVADTLRAEAAETIRRLRRLGIRRAFLLTGDNARVAARVAQDLGLDEVRAELMPEDKVAAIRELASAETLAMVGDGVNDAPALAAASVGIAMGGAGTDVALETADVALMGDDLSRLTYAVSLGRATRAVVKQNLAVSLGVIAFLVVSAVVGWVGIGLAIVFHEGSTLVVVFNSLRLLGHHER